MHGLVTVKAVREAHNPTPIGASGASASALAGSCIPFAAYDKTKARSRINKPCCLVTTNGSIITAAFGMAGVEGTCGSSTASSSLERRTVAGQASTAGRNAR